MKKSVISVKSMVETYVAYGLDDSTWEMFYMMRCHNLITSEVWTEFFNTCRGWQIDPEDGLTIIDTERNDKIIYQADEYGVFVKVK